MQADKEKNQILHYYKFGFNALFDNLNQTTLIVVCLTLPAAVIAFLIEPDNFFVMLKHKLEISFFTILKLIFAQAVLRLVIVFLFILVILRLELQRKGEEIFWDFSLAFSSLKKVLLVDFTFYFGTHIFISFVLIFFNKFITFLLGLNIFTLLCTFVLVVFVAIAVIIRFYFCTF